MKIKNCDRITSLHINTLELNKLRVFAMSWSESYLNELQVLVVRLCVLEEP